jgi:phosphoribosyl 1,2-cyclic phosphodiesterase
LSKKRQMRFWTKYVLVTMNFEPFHSGSKGNLYRLSNESSSILLEAGVSIAKIKQALNYTLSEVDGALITHGHMDHCAGVPGLIKAGVDCYMTLDTARILNLKPSHRLNIIEPLKQFKVAGWTVLPFTTQHDCPGSVGFLITDGDEKMLFCTDTYYIHHRFKGLNIIAVECNWSKKTIDLDLSPERKQRLYRSHFSLENVIKFMQANDLSQVREIWTIHISDGNGSPEYFKTEIQKATGKPVYSKGDKS